MLHNISGQKGGNVFDLHVHTIRVLMLLCTSGRAGQGCNFVMTVKFILYVVEIYRIDELSVKYRARILHITFTGAQLLI
jgi:hypothetical protein